MYSSEEAESIIALEPAPTTERPSGVAYFWDLVRRALDGVVATTSSCVEFSYVLASSEVGVFLEAMADAGLLDKLSYGDAVRAYGEEQWKQRPWPRWCTEPFYVSAKAHRARHAAAAALRIRKAVEHVRRGFLTYTDVFATRDPDEAIRAAYLASMEPRGLLAGTVAGTRRHVEIAPVAMVRLILEAFVKRERLTREVAVPRTKSLIRSFEGRGAGDTGGVPRTADLEDLLADYLADPRPLARILADHGLPSTDADAEAGPDLLADLVARVAAHWHDHLSARRPELARRFGARFTEGIRAAAVPEEDEYRAALARASATWNLSLQRADMAADEDSITEDDFESTAWARMPPRKIQWMPVELEELGPITPKAIVDDLELEDD